MPHIWKQTNVTPIHLKNEPSDASNYRPISLPSTVSKNLGKNLHKYLYNFFRDNNVITAFQSGFVPGDSIVNQLVDIYNTLGEGKEVRAIFCDISKAFDRVWHKCFLLKLKSAGVSGSLLTWFSDHLTDRKQRVVLSAASSSWSSLRFNSWTSPISLIY